MSWKWIRMNVGSRLFVVIPSFNEENTLSEVIHSIPRAIPGVSKVKVLVIDDGSTDNTAKVAEDAGVDKVISFKRNQGLARAFQKGLDIALEMGADVIVNIDADGQYDGGEIPALIEPIVAGKADMVLTDRKIWSLGHMPLSKKIGNTIATWVTRIASEYPVLDGQSGFRAFSREAALQIIVFSDYTYVAETIIRANYKKLKIVQIPCIFRVREGESRLIRSTFHYALRAGLTILRTYFAYKPLKTFFIVGASILALGLLTGMRVLLHYLSTGYVSPYVPTAILTTVLIVVGFQVILIAFMADLLAVNRFILADVHYKLRKLEGK